MTINSENYNPNLASEHWIDAYNTGSHVDLDNFETFTSQFLEQVNNPFISAKDLISCLCFNTFCGIAFTSSAKFRAEPDDPEFTEVPVLNIVYHPFKESRLMTFGEKDTLFGVVGRSPQEPKRRDQYD
jgi:hypothetical protein